MTVVRNHEFRVSCDGAIRKFVIIGIRSHDSKSKPLPSQNPRQNSKLVATDGRRLIFCAAKLHTLQGDAVLSAP